jgi:hypothetical protein
MTKYDPEPLECAGCLRKISAPNVWLCGECMQTAEELGLDVTSFHHPGNDVTKILWDKAMERQRAKTT